MSTTTNPVTMPERKLTHGEIQRWASDAFAAMNVRLSPGKVKTSCFPRLEKYARQHHISLMEQARDLIFTNYKESVRPFADVLYHSVITLRFEPDFDDEWVEGMVHPSVSKRRELELENKGLERGQSPFETDHSKADQEFADKVAAQKAHEQAVRDIEKAISGIVFQNFRGIDQSETDRVRADLRKYMKENLGKSNGVKILRIVKESIAGAHQAYERKQSEWNSR